MNTLIFVDTEAYGTCPRNGQCTEFGAVEFRSRKAFHGVIVKSRPSKENPAIPEPLEAYDKHKEFHVYADFEQWIVQFPSPYTFVSDNPAFDWQWINDGFHQHLGRNPFGFSARRIGDFYAGLCGDWRKSNRWKHLRVTKHDHHPVNDAMGNAEAFAALLEGKR